MNNPELVFKILTECQQYGKYTPLGKSEPKDKKLALSEAEAFDLLDKTGTHRYVLSKEGYLVLEAGSIDKYLELKAEKELQKQTVINNNGNLINGVNYGDLSLNKDLNNPIIQKTVHNTDSTARTKSWMEYTAWIVAIIAGLIAVYEFIVKRFM